MTDLINTDPVTDAPEHDADAFPADRESAPILTAHRAGLLGCRSCGRVWPDDHTICGRCGARMRPRDGGWRRQCTACGTVQFPRVDPVVIMLVTDGGQIIRMPVDDIRVIGRSTQGVTLFKTDGEHVVSVERLSEEEAAEEDATP